MLDEENLGHGAFPDLPDEHDLKYEDSAGASIPLTDEDWQKGYDIEKEIGTKIPIKNQESSESCVAQAFSYYTAVLNAIETGAYDEDSAKALYSQIFLPNGGAYFRDAAGLVVNWGEVLDQIVPSNRPDGTTDEDFMRDKSWLTPQITQLAKILQAKECRSISGLTIDTFAQAIRDGHGMVFGVKGINNGTWDTNEPQPPTGNPAWDHGLFGGKFGIDKLGKFIASPNSWGPRQADALHPGGWQKFRENWFVENGRYIFSPWTLIDKPNLIIDNPMITIKKQGEPAIYLLTGNVLVPFVTDWETYQADFADAKIIELNDTEFAKLKLATAVQITKK